jgi:phosphohistidine phosphatase
MRLWIIRHAKSDWSSPGQDDFDRPLNERGRRDGPRMAAWLAEQKDPAHWIWCSDAVRARSTADFVLDGFKAAKPELVVDHRLYLAGADRLLDVLRETPDSIESVAVVAHNPGLTDLVNLLAGEPVLDNLPTFGIAVFKVKDSWVRLRAESARLKTLMSPKQLPDR